MHLGFLTVDLKARQVTFAVVCIVMTYFGAKWWWCLCVAWKKTQSRLEVVIKDLNWHTLKLQYCKEKLRFMNEHLRMQYLTDRRQDQMLEGEKKPYSCARKGKILIAGIKNHSRLRLWYWSGFIYFFPFWIADHLILRNGWDFFKHTLKDGDALIFMEDFYYRKSFLQSQEITLLAKYPDDLA